MNNSDLYLILMIVLGIFYPIFSVYDGPKTKEQLIQNPEKLIIVYKQTIIIQLVLTSLVFLSLYFNKDTIDLIGLVFIRNIGSIFILMLICFLFLWILYLKEISQSDIETLKLKYKSIIYIIPRSRIEFKWSIALSFLVGTTEEILYRGFLFWQLTLYMSLIPALILTNVIFGILHFGTGIKNAVSTFWLGMIYSAISFPFDTLYFAILVHILTDIYAVSIGFKVNKSISES